MTTPTTPDIRSMVRDAVQPVLAEKMLEAQALAVEEAKRRGATGTPPVSTDAFRGAEGDRRTAFVRNDPHKGLGLDFARAVKIAAVAKMEGRSAADVAKDFQRVNPGYGEVVRALAEGSFAQAGALAQPQATSEFIELLYANTALDKLGARPFSFNSSIEMGKMNSSAVAYWQGEGQNIVPSQPGVGQLAMKRKKLTAIVPLTNELLRNPSVGADTFVRDDLVRIMALKRDLAGIRGTGTEYQPKGVKNWMAAANANAQTGTALSNIVADLMKAIRLVDESDVPMTRPGFLMTPRVKWFLSGLLDGNGNHVFLAMLQSGNLYGFPVVTTTQVPNNLGGGTETEVYFGSWDELIAGSDSSHPLTVETFVNGTYHDGSAVVSGISNDESVIRAIEGVDFMARHNKSFSMITGVTWGA